MNEEKLRTYLKFDELIKQYNAVTQQTTTMLGRSRIMELPEKSWQEARKGYSELLEEKADLWLEMKDILQELAPGLFP